MNPVSNARETESASAAKGLASERQTVILLSLALAVLTFALYLPALHNGFVNYDDPDYVTRNGRVLQGLNWENVKWAFGTNNSVANWHPLTWLSHVADVEIFG